MEPTTGALLVAVLVTAAAVVILRIKRPSDSTEASNAAARVSAQLEEREREVHQVREELATARDERDSARRDLGAAQNKLAALSADHKARVEELTAARRELDNRFKGLAAGALKESTDTLLKQAKEQFDSQRQLSSAELDKRKEAIDAMVAPMRESLGKLDEHTKEIEKERVGAYERLTKQVESLQKTAGGLSEALRSPNIRGQWAEQELGNILELAGLNKHIDYSAQHSVPAPGRVVRPDAVVNVPGGAKIVIDAKAPMESYIKAQEAGDESQEAALLASHAKAISTHAKSLSERDYADAISGSPDFVLMFVPADPILDAAMKVEPTLWEQTWRAHRVLIATPGLLLAFLRTVALAWQQQDMQHNAQVIADLGRDLYDRLRVYAGHMNDIGTGLNKAIDAYNRGVGSLESRVLPQARRFEDLNVVSESKQIPKLSSVETSVRTAASLADGAKELEADDTVQKPSRSLLPRR